MAPKLGKRSRGEEKVRRPKKLVKRFKKQKEYHSASESEDEDVQTGANLIPVTKKDPREETEGGIQLQSTLDTSSEVAVTDAPIKADLIGDAAAEIHAEAEAIENVAAGMHAKADAIENAATKVAPQAETTAGVTAEIEEEDAGADLGSEEDDEGDLESLSEGSFASDEDEAPGEERKRRKRNDPSAFAESISKILSSKLTTSKRADPVLSRSAAASQATKEITDARLEAKAKRKMHAEKKAALDRGRVKDVLGLNSTDVSTAHILEQEKKFKKTAQRGVVKLFNAVRAAQVQGERAREEARKEGVVGMAQREERVSEMSKKGFLDLIAQGGKKAPTLNV